MYKIKEFSFLNETILKLVVAAKEIANNCQPGQFVILKAKEDSERLPFTIADSNKKDGTITLIIQIVGFSTKEISLLKKGDEIFSLSGPLGKASEITKNLNVVLVGGGVGTAVMYPICKAMYNNKNKVTTITGYRDKSLVILEDEVDKVSTKYIRVSDNGSWGEKGFVTGPLERVLENEKVDLVMAFGPLIMMKNVCSLTKKYNVKTMVSLNPLMIDGTGMCGCCRIMVSGKIKFACVDGPDFDGHEVDWDSILMRNTIYGEIERKKYDENCNLLRRDK